SVKSSAADRSRRNNPRFEAARMGRKRTSGQRGTDRGGSLIRIGVDKDRRTETEQSWPTTEVPCSTLTMLSRVSRQNVFHRETPQSVPGCFTGSRKGDRRRGASACPLGRNAVCSSRAFRSVRADFESLSLAAGGLHQPAHAPDRARAGRARLGHH